MRARAKALKDEVRAAKKLETHDRRKAAKRERYRASQEALTQASQSSAETGEGTQQDDAQPPADAQQQVEHIVLEQIRVDHDPLLQEQRPTRKRRKQDSEPKSPQHQPRSRVDAEVQTERSSEDTEEAPIQDADYPRTPPPKKRGCKTRKPTQ